MYKLNKSTNLFQTLLCLVLALFMSVPALAYVTVSSSSHSGKVGETIYLSVPNAQVGYIDHTVWACASPYINFINKDDSGAQIQIASSFNGIAIVELVFVEKYLDSNNRTRAITYYKEFKITCSGAGGASLTSISFEEIEVKIGDVVDIMPTVKPANAVVTYASITPDYKTPSVASIFLFNNQLRVRAVSPGVASATVKTSNGKSAKVRVVVPRPTANLGITDGNGKPISDSNLFKATRNMENLFIKTLEHKK